MPSFNFSKTLVIRFISYAAIIVGLFSLLFQFGPLMMAEFNYRKDKLFDVKHVLPPVVITSAGTQDSSNAPTTSFSDIKSSDKLITPVSTDYGLVIEKINANARVVADVDPANEKEYVKALSKGVAEAKGSTKPGQNGNLYIFSHSADAPWNIVRFNAIFYLLRELEKGDRIIVFYQGRRYDYIVFDKTITKPSDVSFLSNRYDKPVLTLQTCDPPGTLNNRLVIRAQLEGS